MSSVSGSEKRILCVGLMCLDYITIVDGFPQEDTDQRCKEIYWQRGGNACNSCTCLSLLGELGEYLGVVAPTDDSRMLERDMDKRGIHHEHCIPCPGAQTPTCTCISNIQNGSRTILSYQRNLPELTLDQFRQVPLHKHTYKWIHFEGRPSAEIILTMLHHIDQHNTNNSDNRIMTSVELEKSLLNVACLFDAADVVFISKDYAKYQGCSDMVDAVEKLYCRCRKGAVLICAWGEKGAAAQSVDGIVRSSAYPPHTIVDTLAAGDTFNGAVIASLSHKNTVQSAIEFGCRVAGAKCGVRGWRGMEERLNSIHM